MQEIPIFFTSGKTERKLIQKNSNFIQYFAVKKTISILTHHSLPNNHLKSQVPAKQNSTPIPYSLPDTRKHRIPSILDTVHQEREWVKSGKWKAAKRQRKWKNNKKRRDNNSIHQQTGNNNQFCTRDACAQVRQIVFVYLFRKVGKRKNCFLLQIKFYMCFFQQQHSCGLYCMGQCKVFV